MKASPCCLLMLVLCAIACGDGEPLGDCERSLVLITLDTTRQDHIGCYGAVDARTPGLDRIARQGVLFENAIAQVPLTLPAHASILTGTYPPFHGVRGNGSYRLRPERATLAEQLQAAGYRTAAVVASVVVARRHGLDQGFELYDDDPAGMTREGAGSHPSRRAREVTDAALRAARQWGSHDPYFLWAHYFDPHTPYVPDPRFGAWFPDTPAGRYAAEIAEADHHVGRLLAGLRGRKLLENALVLVLGDHGEGFPGPHAESSHGVFLYEDTLRVPFLLQASWLDPARRLVAAPVRQIDVFPTVTDLFGCPGGGEVQGTSLRSLLGGSAPAAADAASYSESIHPWNEYGWSPLHMVRQGNWKLIEAPEPELYDLDLDPAESRNLAVMEPAKLEELREIARRVRSRRPADADPSGSGLELDANEIERLRTLGYAGSAGPQPGADELGKLKDPKRWIHLVARLERASALLAEGKGGQGQRLIEEVLAEDPDNYAANVQLAAHLSDAERLEEAEQPLEKLWMIRPDRPHNLFRLAEVRIKIAGELERRGRKDPAAQKLEQGLADLRCALEFELLDIAGLVRLAAILNNRSEFALAERLLRRALAVESRSLVANLNLGFSLFRQQRPIEAKTYLDEALGLSKDDPAKRRHILPIKGELHFKLGEWTEAVQCLEALLREFPGDPRELAFRRLLDRARAKARPR